MSTGWAWPGEKMRLIEDMTPDELKANHIIVYNGGHHGDFSQVKSIENRITDLELKLEPPLFIEPAQLTLEPEPAQNLNYTFIVERLNQLRAELNYTRKKLDEHLDTTKTKQAFKSSGKL